MDNSRSRQASNTAPGEASGVSSFPSSDPEIILTDAGERLFQIFHRPILNFDNEIRTMQQHNVIGTLRIQSHVAFGWLVPRLYRFQALYPKVELHMSCSNINLDFRDKLVDVAITYGEATHRDLHIVPLMQEMLVPVCSPQYAEEHDLYSGDPEKLINDTLLPTTPPGPTPSSSVHGSYGRSP